MKQKLLLALLALFTLGGSNLYAQSEWVDVTSLFLTNADFEGSYTVQKTFQSGNNERCVYKPNGWTVEHENENNNDITVLKSGDKQSNSFKYFDFHPADGGEQAYLVRFRWGGQYWENGTKGSVDKITLSQLQTIPSGKYRISADLVYITAEDSPSGWLRIYADKTAGGSLGYVDADRIKGTRSGETISSGSAAWVNKTTNEFELTESTEVKFATEFVQSWRWEIQSGVDNYKLEYCPDGEYTIDAALSVCASTDNWSLNVTPWNSGAKHDYNGDTYVEHYWNSLPEVGDYLKYTLKNVPNGTYQIKVTAKSSNTGSRDGFAEVSNGDTKYASIVSGDVEQEIPTWNATDDTTGDTPKQYTLDNVSVKDGKLIVTLKINEVGPNWMFAKIDAIQYQGPLDDIVVAKDAYDSALAEAISVSENADYANVTGKEKADLQDEIDKAEPTTADGYDEATVALTTATNAFIAAKPNYDVLVAEIAKAKALGMNESTVNGYAATAETTAATALANTQNLKVAEYTYVTTTYQYGVTLGEWNSTGKNTTAATFSNEHWSGTTHEYKNQNDNNGQGWNANSWSINFSQDVTLPAGNYVFKVAGRQATGDQVNTSLVVKLGDDVLGSVNDFPRGNSARGINKAGSTSFDENDAEGFANNGNGFGWEWRYVKFTLDEDATVNISINSEATAIHQWVSFGDYTVQTDNEANISLIAYNIALNDARTALSNTDYEKVTGEERTTLQDAIDVDATLDKTNKTAIEEATTALKNATTTFTTAKAAYEEFIAAKTVNYEDNLKYASATKFAAIATAQEANDATSAADATAKTNAIVSAYRKYVESHALAEGVTGAAEIAVPDYRFEGVTECLDVANWKVTNHWLLDSQNNGSISFNTENSLTDGDGNTDYNYIRIQKNDNNAGIHQVMNLEPGKYMMTVAARCEAGKGAKFEAFAGGKYVSIPQNNNVNGQFGKGWNDVSVEFIVTETSDITFGVKSDWGKNIWWTATRFRLVKLPTDEVTLLDAATEAPAASDFANVTYYRTLTAGFNSLVLPFDVTKEELGGEKVEEIYSYNGCTVTGEGENVVYHLDFQKGVETLKANTPYLVNMTEAVNLTSFNGKEIKPVEEPKVEKEYFSFVGSYVALEKGNDVVKAGDYGCTTSGLKKAKDGIAMKAFRAYMKNTTGNTEAKVNIMIDGQDTDAITAVEIFEAMTEGIYNLQGQKVNHAQKGVFIVNGKKVVVK